MDTNGVGQRHLVREGRIEVVFVGTNDNQADALTKPLIPRDSLCNLRDQMLGLTPVTCRVMAGPCYGRGTKNQRRRRQWRTTQGNPWRKEGELRAPNPGLNKPYHSNRRGGPHRKYHGSPTFKRNVPGGIIQN